MSIFSRSVLGLVVLVGVAFLPGWQVAGQGGSNAPDLSLFFRSASTDTDEAEDALEEIAASWHDGYVPIFRDLMRLMTPPLNPPPRTAPFDPSGRRPGGGRNGAGPVDFPQREAPEAPSTMVWRRLGRFIADQTPLRLRGQGSDLAAIQQWMWAQPYQPHPDYALFKGIWYGRIDPRFTDFFPDGVAATIRLDEIDWGGVPVNGIPPLVYPPHAAAGDAEAAYLDNDDIVFGLAVNNAARAYPQRVLAWHEMALDTLWNTFEGVPVVGRGDIELTIVYFTLCGTVIPYESTVDGEQVTFGTSGLLYRSNKLMFERRWAMLRQTVCGTRLRGSRSLDGVSIPVSSSPTVLS